MRARSSASFSRASAFVVSTHVAVGDGNGVEGLHGRQLIAGRLLQAEGALVLLERQVETAVRPVDTPEAHIRASQAAPVADLVEAGGRVRYRAERLIVAPEHELLVAPLVQQAALGGAGVGRGSNQRQRLVAQAVLLGTGLDGIRQVLVDADEQLRIADRPRQVERAARAAAPLRSCVRWR